MSDERRFFFILGMPRSRTAWLSVALTYGDSVCLHEGVAGCGSFGEYAAKLRAVPSAIVGDSDPALVYWVPQLRAEFPNARFLVVWRDPAEALRSLKAAEPERAAEIDSWWDGYVKAFYFASSELRPCLEAFFARNNELSNAAFVKTCTKAMTGQDAPVGHVERLADLNITTCRKGVSIAPPRPVPAVLIPRDFLEARGVTADGLSVRLYSPEDYPMVNEWWRTHRREALQPVTLPPLGVVVSGADGAPIGALWCYESFGVGVAMLEWPVTKPGLSMAEAARAMSFAVASCIYLAGKRCEPAGQYQCFRVATSPPIARFLKRLGFRAEQDPRISMTLQL